MCAVTMCPFSSSTLKVVFGNVSITVPSICIASSLATRQQVSTRIGGAALLHNLAGSSKPAAGLFETLGGGAHHALMCHLAKSVVHDGGQRGPPPHSASMRRNPFRGTSVAPRLSRCGD